jgi:hypothetical protein
VGYLQVPAAQVGHDGDFGASPVVFNKYVGACDNDGIFYLLNQASMTCAGNAASATRPKRG